MISDPKQKAMLKNARDLIQDCLYGEISHKNQCVYLRVAADYCKMVSGIEKERGRIDDET